jgi:hypothetical protein
MDLKERAIQLLEDRKKRISDFSKLQPDHPFTIANKHMLELSEQTSWNATGELSMTGFLWWALNLTADLAFPNYIFFNATGGPGADIAAFTAPVTGFFYVDPSTLNGQQLNFTLQAVAGGLGEVSLDLFDGNWNQSIASLVGVPAGVSLSYISGTGSFSYD